MVYPILTGLLGGLTEIMVVLVFYIWKSYLKFEEVIITIIVDIIDLIKLLDNIFVSRFQ